MHGVELRELPMFYQRTASHLTRLAAIVVVFATTVGSASANGGAPQRAWGKAGVTYEQYRDDALECGKEARAADIDQSAPVETLRRASGELATLDNQMGATSYSNDGMSDGLKAVVQQRQMVVQTARPDQQYVRIKQLMFETARSCMTKNGYSRFNLTSDQRKAFSKLDGVEARRHYLYDLASDENVLSAQKYTNDVSR